jgi:hypothetical protein
MVGACTTRVPQMPKKPGNSNIIELKIVPILSLTPANRSPVLTSRRQQMLSSIILHYLPMQTITALGALPQPPASYTSNSPPPYLPLLSRASLFQMHRQIHQGSDYTPTRNLTLASCPTILFQRALQTLTILQLTSSL